ncbi:MAG: hypothetical protein AAF639_19405 [Chloroflexota bacterium]
MNAIQNPIAIGKIVKSNTHIDYICQVYNPGEIDVLPQPTDYTYGTFVSIELENSVGGVFSGSNRLIGVIYDTLLMNPDFGNLGPRLSPRQELEIFTPDYLAETATLLGILALGWMDASGQYHQGVPALAATVNTPVNRLTGDELEAFHRDDSGQLQLRYIPVLLGQNTPLVSQLLMNIVDLLKDLFPNEQGQLAVLRNNLAWKSIVEPAG